MATAAPTPAMRLSTYRWLVPGPACVLLQVSFGSFYAYGVFSSRLSTPALTYALGLAAALLSASLTAAGISLHRRPPPASPARRLALASAAFLAAAAALPAFAGTAPAAPRPAFLAIAAAALGTGYGVLYVVSIHTVQAWFPEAPGTATGAVVAAGGAGTLFYVALNTALANARPTDVPAAMRTSAAVATATALAAAAAITLPPDLRWHPDDEAAATAESAPLVKRRVSSRGASSSSPPRLTARDLLVDPLFYLLLTTVTSSVGPGFGVVLHGSRMQTALFAVSPAVADARFFGITLVGVAGRLAVGVAVDAYTAAVVRRSAGSPVAAATADAAGAPFVAARAANLGLLGAQAVALVAAVGLARAGGDGAALLFAVALSAVYLTFSGAAVVTACLCRATFAPENATLAFSLVGLAIGLGDVSFSALVASCAKRHPIKLEALPAVAAAAARAMPQHAKDYDAFFAVSLVFTAVGICACVALVPAELRLSNAAPFVPLSVDGAPPSLYDDLMCTKDSMAGSQDVLEGVLLDEDDDLRELREFAFA